MICTVLYDVVNIVHISVLQFEKGTNFFAWEAHDMDDNDRSMYTAWNNSGTVAMNRRYIQSYEDGNSVHG